MKPLVVVAVGGLVLGLTQPMVSATESGTQTAEPGRPPAGSAVVAARFEEAPWNPGSPPDRLTDFAERINDSVVTVHCGGSLGSAWSAAVTIRGSAADAGYESYLVTNHHVIEECTYQGTRYIEVRRNGISYPAYVWSWDQENDLAAVYTMAEIPQLEWDRTPRPRIGQWVAAFGSPYGLSGSMTVGSVSYVGDSEVISTAPINPGNSGGPLVDNLGRVLGVNTAGIIGGNNVGIVKGTPLLCDWIFECGDANDVWLSGITPSAPRNVSASQTSVGVLVSWMAPSSNGGQPIRDYLISVNPGGITQVCARTSCFLDDLMPGETYSIFIQARNDIGLGDPSVTVNFTPLGPPLAVSNLKARSIKGGLKITWRPPANIDVKVNRYEFKVKGGSWTRTKRLKAKVTGFKQGKRLVVQVRAFGDAGFGPVKKVVARAG